MTQYSIAEARRRLSEIVDAALDGAPARITRRGREVAVIVSAAEFERLRAGRPSFREAYWAYRAEFPERPTKEGDEQLGPDFWDSLRDREPGRELSL
jgi:prevent-host-death family protein